MKFIYSVFLPLLFVCSGCSTAPNNNNTLIEGDKVVIDKTVLKDKIAGAWAGQVIGCTFGGPTEFKFKGTMIPDEHFIPWYDGIIKWWYDNAPGLYDDVYMDLTFVDVFEKEGLDAPIESFANAFAHADYQLWHANQAARYNILNGIMPPESGHWKYNPHADDIDFQIEADFAGIMSPGMVNTATDISDGIGHIMNYGDGWYGGVYVAAMYSLAFVSDDIEFIVKEGLKSIPSESQFYKLMSDVIEWYEMYPEDWKMTWFLTQKKWASEVGCPDGVFEDFNIDAKINAAYIIIGLLYGNSDFGESIRISTLCGQDSDCNPASAAGILGVLYGYSGIPEEWKLGLDDVEDIDFKYTDISLNDAYSYSFNQAIKVIEKNGGSIEDKDVTIIYQAPAAVRLEQGFEGHFPVEYLNLNQNLNKENPSFKIKFEGNGIVVRGGWPWGSDPELIGKLEVYLDGEFQEAADIPADYRTRRHDLTWAYGLDAGKHTLELKLSNPLEGISIEANKIIIYAPNKERRVRPGIVIER